MFNVGEIIVYGTEGVFVVSEHTSSPIDKNDDRVFYVLKPVYGSASNVIYTPANNDRIKMRAVMSSEEANSFIERIPSIEPLQVECEKKRRIVYREAMINADIDDYVSIIKSVREKREDCIKNKKRLSESDSDYERRAQFCLYGELSIALEIGFNEVEGYISERLSVKEAD